MTYLATHEGYFISEKHRRVAEILNDYDPDLQLVWIPPTTRSEEDRGKEFAVLHTLNGKQYIIFHVGEDEVDERLLARVWSSDNGNGNVLGKLDALNAAAEAMRLKEEMELAEERAELAATIYKSPLHTYKHNGVTYQ